MLFFLACRYNIIEGVFMKVQITKLPQHNRVWYWDKIGQVFNGKRVRLDGMMHYDLGNGKYILGTDCHPLNRRKKMRKLMEIEEVSLCRFNGRGYCKKDGRGYELKCPVYLGVGDFPKKCPLPTVEE
jgi:hypothetical protein